MRKIYSLLFMMVMAMGATFHASAEEDQFLTIVFSPEDSGYVVTTQYDENYNTVETGTYEPDQNGEVQLPYDNSSQFQIRPNTNGGYGLVSMVNETAQKTNPHYYPESPRGDGYIWSYMSSHNAGDILVVTASKGGTFTVVGIGDKVDAAYMRNTQTYTSITLSTEETTIEFNGGAKYQIGSNNYSTPDQLWKVEVTYADGYTEELSGNYGNFEYAPQDGDKVRVYTDKPKTYAKLNFAFDGVPDAIIDHVEYNYQTIDREAWQAGDYQVESGYYLYIYLNKDGYETVYCALNGAEKASVYGDTQSMLLENGNPDVAAEYNFVFSADKEQVFNVTINTENPEAFQIVKLINGYTEGSAYDFSKSGDVIEVGSGNKTIKFKANNGWRVDGILVDGVAPEYFYNSSYTVEGDCTIEVNVTDLNANRTKTAVVYVDEDAAWYDGSVSLSYVDYTQNRLEKGYNFIKFSDEDLPFTFSAYSTEGSTYYMVNNMPIVNSYRCEATESLADGAVIKYFLGEPTPVKLSYTVDDEVKDAVEVYHDHVTKFDHTTGRPTLSYRGTQIHVKTIAAAARAAGVEFLVKDGDKVVNPDENGVYSIVVGPEEKEKNIIITTDLSSGIADSFVDADKVFDIFSIQGVVVKRNATNDDLKALPAGIYVAGGKKVVVK